MKRLLGVLPLLCLAASSVLLMGPDCGPGKDCIYNGKTFGSGAAFTSDDLCNTCSCEDGNVACTARACAYTWWKTCGDPVCSTHRVDPNVRACTSEQVGQGCTKAGDVCDPGDMCNSHYQCAAADPTKTNGGCPISRAKYKRDIRYLDDAELAEQERRLLEMKLATYRYKSAGESGPLQLGFIIDDVGQSPSVNADGESVNLYGYASMAVAALKVQARQIAELREEVGALKKELAAKKVVRRR